jgi:carotenoid cleavage dioxygenase
MMEYPSAPLFPNPDGSRRVPVKARLVHWRIDLADHGARVERTAVSDLVGEFPRIDDRFAGLAYRHCWHAANAELNEALMYDSLAHIDLHTKRTTLRRFLHGDSVGEPVFVPRHAQAPEGDGWVLAVLHRALEDRSDLLILNALVIAGEPAAILELPCRVPAGFHGSWVGG